MRTISYVLLAAICGLTAIWCDSVIGTKAVGTDGLQNYQGAYNLATTGVLSFTEKGAGQPSMSREPFPPFVLAGWLKAVFPDIETASPSAINGSADVVWVKRFNVLLAVLIVLAVFLNTKLVTRNNVAPLVASFLAGASMVDWSFGLNSMYTEPVAALVLLLASAASIYWVQCDRWFQAGLFGFIMGILALTKAVGATIFFPALLLVSAFAWAQNRNFK